ncbi:hypothetical protein [Mumia zhuanghuii]|uniref:hypothetical protein n=1 Tax=Mumia zhuanghuii TaxID=2585211 RepID=UPI001890E05B|nr:hypothetical protein [Mumia zhuanghuii]
MSASTTYTEDHPDFVNADRGFVGTISPPTIKDAAGNVVFDASALDFVTGETPDTVHPSLWRRSCTSRPPATSRPP